MHDDCPKVLLKFRVWMPCKSCYHVEIVTSFWSYLDLEGQEDSKKHTMMWSFFHKTLKMYVENPNSQKQSASSYSCDIRAVPGLYFYQRRFKVREGETTILHGTWNRHHVITIPRPSLLELSGNWVVKHREIEEDDEFVHQKPHRLHQTPHDFQKRGARAHQERKPGDLAPGVSQSVGEHWRCAGTARAKCGGGASYSPLGHKWLAPTPRWLSHIAPVYILTYAQLKSQSGLCSMLRPCQYSNALQSFMPFRSF